MRNSLLIALCVIGCCSLPIVAGADDHEHRHGGHHNHNDHTHEERAHGDLGDEHHADEHGDAEDAHGLRLSESRLEALGIKIQKAGPAAISEGVDVSGRLVPVDAKLAHVSPRFSGVVREVHAQVGDAVQPGTPLAVIQNNQNLQTFTLSPAIAGTVIKRHATLGETVTEESVLFIVADLSEVWAELAVYKQDVDRIRTGQRARVSVGEHLPPLEGEVIFFSPITEEQTQSRVARILLKQPPEHFSAGAYVTGRIITAELQVPVAVENHALQRMEGRTVLFVRDGELLEPRAVLPGRSDGRVTEIVNGLQAGEDYASGNTFLLKAELGKSAAEHHH